MESRHRLIVFALFTVISLSIFPLFAQQAMMGGNRQAGVTLQAVEPQELYRRSLYGGRIEPLYSYPQPTLISGIIRNIYVKAGDYVQRGQLLYTVQQIVVAQEYLPTPIYAQNSGVVVNIEYRTGDRVQANTSVLTISNIDHVKMSLYIGESDFSQLNVGDTVYLSGRIANAERIIEEAKEKIARSENAEYIILQENIILEQEQIIKESEGTITSLPLVPNYQTGLFSIEVTFIRSPSLFFGKFERVELRTHRTTSLAVPQSSIITRYGRKHVVMVDEENKIVYRVVEIGDAFGENVVILAGLEAGEEIAVNLSGRVPQQGDQVRVIRAGDTPSRQGNNGGGQQMITR